MRMSMSSPEVLCSLITVTLVSTLASQQLPAEPQQDRGGGCQTPAIDHQCCCCGESEQHQIFEGAHQ